MRKKIVKHIGPETILFFKRFAILRETGIAEIEIIRPQDAASKELALKQAAIVAEQTGIDQRCAVEGILFIWARERLPFDPLTLPWLN